MKIVLIFSTLENVSASVQARLIILEVAPLMVKVRRCEEFSWSTEGLL